MPEVTTADADSASEPKAAAKPESARRLMACSREATEPNLCGEWIAKLNGYEFRLWDYQNPCSRLTLRGSDCIARRPDGRLVLHDVTYLEMPLATGKVKLREASEEEYAHVRENIGANVRASNVIAFQASAKRIFLIEFGFAQWLSD